MKKLIWGLALAAVTVPLQMMGGCGSENSDGIAPPADDGGPEGGGSASTGGSKAVGETCTNSIECGTRNCDGTTKRCAESLVQCKTTDTACTATTECCSGACINAKCTGKQCTADSTAC